MKTNLTSLLALSAFAVAIPVAHGATVVFYDFATDLNPTTEAANTSSTAVAGEGFGGTGRSSFENNAFGRGISMDVGESYLGFTINADSGFTLDLTDLSFLYRISQIEGASTEFTFEVRSSVDGFAAEVPGTYSTNPTGVSGSNRTASFDLTGGDFAGLETVTFRLGVTGNGASNFNDIARWDDILVEGSVIPEPSAALLGSLGLLALLRRRR